MITFDANVWVAAADRRDEYYAASRDFLRAVARRGLPIYLPAVAPIEIACALARRRRNPVVGQVLATALLEVGNVVQVPLDGPLLAHALHIGTHALLSGADALYVAAAELHQTRLVSWDTELVLHAGAITPHDWMAETT